MNTTPLCVDLDGTLLKTDTLFELIARVLVRQPWMIVMLFIWLLQGKPVLKYQLSKRCQLAPDLLPYNHELLAYLKTAHNEDRKIFLVTGAYFDVAKSIANYLGIFDGVFSTDAHQNLTGKNKADFLVNKFGTNGYDYAGNDEVDYPVWREARRCYLVNATPAVSVRAKKQFSFFKEMDAQKITSWKLYLKAIRLHQWAKNLLIFVPIFASHHVFDFYRLTDTLVAFIAFGCCASFSYIINDISDLDADRKHHSKFRRPFASAMLSIPTGLGIASGLLAFTVLLSALLPAGFIYSLLVYFLVTNLYTLRLKHIPILDVGLLAGLYTLRVIAGGFAADAPVSFWLLAFSGFIFFSLAIVKRMSELLNIETPDAEPVICRGYSTSDIPVLTGLGTASAMMAVLVLALYINSPDIIQLYTSPRYLWLLCPVFALWLGRVWLITGRGEMHDDPVVFALRDRVSWLLFGVAALFILVGANF
ncbi:MAG TPA: UbiA family prenyltransferase [Pseudomonadales bacterium]|nr:UbiA family prenyltransferase [Pseudomonadales bacterium]